MQINEVIEKLKALPARLTASDIDRELGIKEQALRNKYNADQFPRPHKDLGSRINRWWTHEIIAHYVNLTAQN